MVARMKRYRRCETMKMVSSQESRVVETRRKDGVGSRRDYFGIAGSLVDGPQGFLVERPYAGARIDPHFHDIDQFQVIVAGDGRIGKKDVMPVTFQYADAYTPYGPIVARDDGISFFTLRNVASGGHFSMPGSKHLMPCRAGRNIAGGIKLDGAKLVDGDVARKGLMEPQDDGVHAEGIHLGPNASTPGIQSDAGGQYYLVCGGTLVEKGETLDELSLLHVKAGEETPVLTAGPDGATVLALQFSRPSERPGSDPRKLSDRDPNAYVLKTEKH
jgi:hypothetical protein